MVDVTLEALNLDELAAQDTYIAVRVGESQKLARIAPSRNFKFPQSALGNRKIGKVDVLQRVGSINIHVKQETSDAAQEIEIPAGTEGSVAKFRVLLGGEKNNASDIANKPAPKEVNPKVIEARSYLSDHNLEVRLSEAMQAVLRVRPANPSEFIFERLLQSEGGSLGAHRGERLISPQKSQAVAADSPKKSTPSPAKRHDLPSISETRQGNAPEGESVPTTLLTNINELEPPPLPGMKLDFPPREPPSESVAKSLPCQEVAQESKSVPPLGFDNVVPQSLPIRSPAASEVPAIKLAPTPRWNQRPSAVPFVSSSMSFRLQAAAKSAFLKEPVLSSSLLKQCVEVALDDCREKIGRSFLAASKNGNLQTKMQELVDPKSATSPIDPVIDGSVMQRCVEAAADDSKEKLRRSLVVAAKSGSLQASLKELVDWKPAKCEEADTKDTPGIMQKCIEVVVDQHREKIGRSLLCASMNGSLQASTQEVADTKEPPGIMQKCIEVVVDQHREKLGRNLLCASMNGSLQASTQEVADAKEPPGIMQKCIEVVVDQHREKLGRSLLCASMSGSLEASTQEVAEKFGQLVLAPGIMQKCVEVTVDEHREKIGRSLLCASRTGSLQAQSQEAVRQQ